MNNKESREKKASNIEKEGWEHSRACWVIFGAYWRWEMKNS